MKERSMIFSGQSVRAILNRTKSQSRRVIKPQPTGYAPLQGYRPNSVPHERENELWGWCTAGDQCYDEIRRCPYGQLGDRLWVRETWKHSLTQYHYGKGLHGGPNDPCYGYKATMTYTCGEPIPDYPISWESPIYMPKITARLWLEVVSVRAERLQEISYDDIVAEGWNVRTSEPFTDGIAGQDARAWFRDLWDSLNAKRGCGWETNPWVWVVAFSPIAGMEEE